MVTSGSSPWWCSPRCGGITAPRGITRPSREKRTSFEAKPWWRRFSICEYSAPAFGEPHPSMSSPTHFISLQHPPAYIPCCDPCEPLPTTVSLIQPTSPGCGCSETSVIHCILSFSNTSMCNQPWGAPTIPQDTLVASDTNTSLIPRL